MKLIYFEEFDDKIEAMRREYRIKKMSRKEKKKMIIQLNTSSFVLLLSFQVANINVFI